jgi:hypothetical protein
MIAAKPIITHIFTMFEPKTFPTEIDKPVPDNAAMTATVNSGKEVEKAIRLKPTEVFPSRVMLATFTALPIVRLLAQFRTRKETAMTSMSTANPVSSISAKPFPSQTLLTSFHKHFLRGS